MHQAEDLKLSKIYKSREGDLGQRKRKRGVDDENEIEISLKKEKREKEKKNNPKNKKIMRQEKLSKFSEFSKIRPKPYNKGRKPPKCAEIKDKEDGNLTSEIKLAKRLTFQLGPDGNTGTGRNQLGLARE